METPSLGPDQSVTEEADVDIPDPSECVVPPRTIDEVRAIAAEPGTPEAHAASDVLALLVGDPGSVSASVALQMELTVREAVACLNAGQTLQLWALFTDDYLRRSLADADEPGSATEFPSFATPSAERREPMPELVAFWHLADGRVLARVLPVDDRPISALTHEPGELLVVFALVDGDYRIDEVFVASNGRPERPASPVAVVSDSAVPSQRSVRS